MLSDPKDDAVVTNGCAKIINGKAWEWNSYYFLCVDDIRSHLSHQSTFNSIGFKIKGGKKREKFFFYNFGFDVI